MFNVFLNYVNIILLYERVGKRELEIVLFVLKLIYGQYLSHLQLIHVGILQV